MQDAEFEEMEESAETTGALVVIEKTDAMEDILNEADEVNKKAIIEDLQELGESYELADNRLKEAKLSIKSILDDAKERGISKTMLEAYVSLRRMSALNKKAIFGAVVEDEGAGDE